MKIIVFGATGAMGSRVIKEAVSRGHEVTATVRNQESISKLPADVTGVIVNARDQVALAHAMKGHDVAISALRSPSGREGEVVGLTRTVLSSATQAGIRVIVVGGAARLKLSDSSPHTVLSDPDFLPEEIVPIARASLAQAELCQLTSDADWTYASPSAMLLPGQRTGVFRTGRDTLLMDEDGQSSISMEDFSVALVNEAETPRFQRASFTVGY
ncbi:MAG: NAD(P)H-binding protein [Pseudomonadota bacterium]|nr:NAD(P)H-binding protein [Pseudomonadota bacterium]